MKILYFVYLFLCYNSLYGMHDQTGEVTDIISYEKIKEMSQNKIEKASHYIYYANNKKSFYTVLFFENNLDVSTKTIKIKMKSNDNSWKKRHRNYCNSLLDINSNIFPTVIQIKKNKINNNHSLHLHNKKTLMNVHDFKLPDDLNKPTHFMDLRNINNSSVHYCQPLAFFKNVQIIEYHNGFYTEKILTYDSNNFPSIHNTWQHTSVQIIKWSLLLIVLLTIRTKYFK